MDYLWLAFVAWFQINWYTILYGIPVLVAVLRRNRHRNAILALNALLGWTVIGWMVALVWSLMDQERQNNPDTSGNS